jgi:hypothetical protein
MTDHVINVAGIEIPPSDTPPGVMLSMLGDVLDCLVTPAGAPLVDKPLHENIDY